MKYENMDLGSNVESGLLSKLRGPTVGVYQRAISGRLRLRIWRTFAMRVGDELYDALFEAA